MTRASPPPPKVNIQFYHAPPKDVKCPYFRDWMYKCCPKCVKWIRIENIDGVPLTGGQCSDNLLVQLMLDNNKFNSYTGASVDKLTNEIVKRSNRAQVSARQLAPPPAPMQSISQSSGYAGLLPNKEHEDEKSGQ